MKILISTPAFFPMVGGVEKVTENLALLLHNRGNQVTVITPTPNPQPDSFPYPVIRTNNKQIKLQACQQADVVFSNGASLFVAFEAKKAKKPFLWLHVGYQAGCLDGLGWLQNKPAPLTPMASFVHHLFRRPIKALPALAKVMLLRHFGKRVVTHNLVITDWVGKRLQLPRQKRIYNPFEVSFFEKAKRNINTDFDFVFLGRLVSEKGVDVLIEAMAKVIKQAPQASLLIIGSGPEEENYKRLAEKLNANKNILFAGKKTGDRLLNLIEKCNIGVIPSSWEEPMGGVVVELMAAGKPLIVSENGGLAECAGNACLTFPNRNAEILAEKMLQLLNNKALQQDLVNNSIKRLPLFNEAHITNQYISLFEQLVPKQEV